MVKKKTENPSYFQVSNMITCRVSDAGRVVAGEQAWNTTRQTSKEVASRPGHVGKRRAAAHS
jgi:hypothetical protein